MIAPSMGAAQLPDEDTVASIHLSAISYELGDQHLLSELGEIAAADMLRPGHGLEHFLASGREIRQLARCVGERTVARSPSAPDLLIYVSENDERVGDSLARVAHDIGLPTVRHLAISGNGCGNLVPALQVAWDALHSGRHDQVLLVLADRALDGERVMLSGLSVFSDSAAACMITREPTEADGTQVVIRALTTRSRVQMEANQTDLSLLAKAELAEAGINEILRATDCTRDDFEYALLPNYRIASQRFLLAALKLPADRLLVGPVGELGHCFSADVLITLDRYTDSARLRVGDRLLVSTPGAYTWSMMACEVTRAYGQPPSN